MENKVEHGIYHGSSGQQLWWIRFYFGDDDLMHDVCEWAVNTIGDYTSKWWLEGRFMYFINEQDWLLFRMAWL